MKDRFRAGQYVPQPTGYRAFLPAALPPKPPIRFTEELQALLAEAALALGRLDGSIQTLPNSDLFVLSEFTGQTRNRLFLYQSYIDLFHKDT